MSVETKLLEIANNVNKVYKAGFNMGNIKAQKNPLRYATNLNFLWSKVAFPKDFDMLLEIENPEVLSSAFIQTSGMKSAKIICKNPTNVNLQALFRESVDLESVDFTEFLVALNGIAYLFYGDIKLKTILGALDLSHCIVATGAFNNAIALENIEFVPQTIKLNLDFSSSKLLTKESLLSILNGLYDYNLNYDLIPFRPDFIAYGETVSGTYKITEVDVTDIDIGFLTEGGYRFRILKSDCGDEWESLIDAFKVDRYIEFLGDYDSSGVMRFETINLLSNPDSVAYTLNLGAANLNKLNDEEKQIAENKGWILK